MAAEQGISEYISTYGNTLPFTPNNAVISVPVGVTPPVPFVNIASNPNFQYGDTVLIDTIYIAVPYQWGTAELGPINLSLGWADVGVNSGALEIFSGTCRGNIPNVEIEFPVNTIVETPSGAADRWYITLTGLWGLNINMINSPAALNTIVQYCRIMFHVRHTFTMVP